MKLIQWLLLTTMLNFADLAVLRWVHSDNERGVGSQREVSDVKP